jgi:hypothetical protein
MKQPGPLRIVLLFLGVCVECVLFRLFYGPGDARRLRGRSEPKRPER